MPNPNPKKPAHVWKKGQSGNPKGTSAKQRLGGEIAKLTHAQVAEVGTLLLTGGLEEMQGIVRDKNSSMLKVWTATLIIKSMKDGDSATYDRVLNRVVGKVKENLELSGRGGGPIELSVAQMEEQLAFLRKKREEAGSD